MRINAQTNQVIINDEVSSFLKDVLKSNQDFMKQNSKTNRGLNISSHLTYNILSLSSVLMHLKMEGIQNYEHTMSTEFM